MSEFRIDIKVRNNIILHKLEQAGYKTIGEFCRLNNVMKYVSTLGDIVAMKTPPLKSNGDFVDCIKYLAEKIGCDELDLFTDSQLHTILKTNKHSVAVKEAELKYMLSQENNIKLLDEVIDQNILNNKLMETLDTLTKREKKVLEMRYGLGENTIIKTQEECAIALDVSRERIRQIEAKALRKLRHPSRCEPIRKLME